MDWTQVTDWDLVCERLAAAEPWWEPGTAQGYHMTTFGFILGEVFRRVTGNTVGQYLRAEIAEPLGAEIHIGLPRNEQHRCADRVAKPHIRQMLADVNAPGYPTSLAEHPKAGLAVSMGFAPDDEVGSNDLDLWRELEFPGTNGQVSALGLATFYNALAQEKLLSRKHMDLIRVSQGGLDTDLVLGPRVADHGWGLGYMLNQRCVNGPNPVDLRPRRPRRLVRFRRPGEPDRLRLRDESFRRDQGQRRPPQRRHEQRDLRGTRGQVTQTRRLLKLSVSTLGRPS
jgi:CubicO group peptidase (beta-lactamase class C family)